MHSKLSFNHDKGGVRICLPGGSDADALNWIIITAANVMSQVSIHSENDTFLSWPHNKYKVIGPLLYMLIVLCCS